MTRMVNKRLVLKSLAGAAATSLLAPLSWAQTFPSRLVSLVVPYPAGGGSDVIARGLVGQMGKVLGQTVIVENQGGASGTIAVQKLLGEPADGYKVFVGSPNELILAPMAIAAAKFKSEDFRLVQKVANFTLAALVPTALPVSNMDELIAYAARRAKEGKPLTYGSVGNGSIYHLLGEQLSKVTGVPMIHVPYRGGAPMTTDLVGGQIDLYLGAMGANSPGMVAAGKLKLLAIISPERLDTYKDVPSVSDTPSLKNFRYSLWVGLLVKKGTPEPVIQALHQATTTAMKDPALAHTAASVQDVLAQPQSLAQADQIYAESIAQFRAIAQSVNLKAE